MMIELQDVIDVMERDLTTAVDDNNTLRAEVTRLNSALALSEVKSIRLAASTSKLISEASRRASSV